MEPLAVRSPPFGEQPTNKSKQISATSGQLRFIGVDKSLDTAALVFGSAITYFGVAGEEMLQPPDEHCSHCPLDAPFDRNPGA